MTKTEKGASPSQQPSRKRSNVQQSIAAAFQAAKRPHTNTPYAGKADSSAQVLDADISEPVDQIIIETQSDSAAAGASDAPNLQAVDGHPQTSVAGAAQAADVKAAAAGDGPVQTCVQAAAAADDAAAATATALKHDNRRSNQMRKQPGKKSSSSTTIKPRKSAAAAAAVCDEGHVDETHDNVDPAATAVADSVEAGFSSTEVNKVTLKHFARGVLWSHCQPFLLCHE